MSKKQCKSDRLDAMEQQERSNEKSVNRKITSFCLQLKLLFTIILLHLLLTA